MQRRTKVMIVVATLLIIIGIILYGLARRYLIEQVEVDLGSSTTSTAPVTESDDLASYDDWNYKDSDIAIKVQKVHEGTGSDTVTYYVADVLLANSSNLMTAFAKNQFGRNIIENTSTISAEHNAILAINGDYYGFRNDGVIIRNGELYRDDPARDAVAIFEDGTLQTYNEEEQSSSSLLAGGVTNTFSFGPILVKDSRIVDDFDSVKIDSNFGNRSIHASNPRTGIGILAPNHYVFIVVDGRMTNYSRGMTLSEFADLFERLGATDAYNLDGGGSSTMYFMGRVVNNPLGKGKERGVSDIIYIGRS